MLKSDYLDPIWYALIWTDLKTAFFCCFGTTQNPNLRFNYRCQNSEQKIDLLNCYCDYRSKNIAKNLRFFTLISWQLIILLVPLLSTMGFFFVILLPLTAFAPCLISRVKRLRYERSFVSLYTIIRWAKLYYM